MPKSQMFKYEAEKEGLQSANAAVSSYRLAQGGHSRTSAGVRQTGGRTNVQEKYGKYCCSKSSQPDSADSTVKDCSLF
jgi:hypothetical protein